MKIGIPKSNMFGIDSWKKTLSPLIENLVLTEIRPKNLKNVDIIIFDGGADIHPNFYGQFIEKGTHVHSNRDFDELFLFKYYYNTPTKFAGICRGHQLLNVLMHGTLIQDLPSNKIFHGSSHSVVNENQRSVLTKYIPKKPFIVNSLHHQAVDKLGLNLMGTIVHNGYGTVEGIESMPGTGDKIRAVQSHPEMGFNDGRISDNVLRYLLRCDV